MELKRRIQPYDDMQQFICFVLTKNNSMSDSELMAKAASLVEAYSNDFETEFQQFSKILGRET